MASAREAGVAHAVQTDGKRLDQRGRSEIDLGRNAQQASRMDAHELGERARQLSV